LVPQWPVDGSPDYVWYVAYGPNLCRRHLQARLARGRDRSWPRADRPLVIAHELFFSRGRAQLDHAPRPGVRTRARAWLLAAEQWQDLVALESGHEGATKVIAFGERAGFPMLTCTGPDPLELAACSMPSAAHLNTIAMGLREAHGMGAIEAARYLVRRPGVAGAWRATDLLIALGRRQGRLGAA
jgi:hypothetical protein